MHSAQLSVSAQCLRACGAWWALQGPKSHGGEQNIANLPPGNCREWSEDPEPAHLSIPVPLPWERTFPPTDHRRKQSPACTRVPMGKSVASSTQGSPWPQQRCSHLWPSSPFPECISHPKWQISDNCHVKGQQIILGFPQGESSVLVWGVSPLLSFPCLLFIVIFPSWGRKAPFRGVFPPNPAAFPCPQVLNVTPAQDAPCLPGTGSDDDGHPDGAPSSLPRQPTGECPPCPHPPKIPSHCSMGSAVRWLWRQFEWRFDWFYGIFGKPSQGKRDFIYSVAPRSRITSFPSVITELVIVRKGIWSKRNSASAPQCAGCGDLGSGKVGFWGWPSSLQPIPSFWGANLYFWFGLLRLNVDDPDVALNWYCV